MFGRERSYAQYLQGMVNTLSIEVNDCQNQNMSWYYRDPYLPWWTAKNTSIREYQARHRCRLDRGIGWYPIDSKGKHRQRTRSDTRQRSRSPRR